ncbi:DUF5368 family protein [Falsiroseomonas sp.]|uniref:DUF5368 family protein n=1 Tax=Falsiroseomonas sp. TaxID=2870721 RepID=UPI0027367D7A|nr:DUF5368 family protein [Falsiroseomonas sp.]MDP3415033.1 DUF5368 family protein [Falsiroseomonas sp.]
MQDFEIWMFIAVFQEMLGWAIWPIAALCVAATLALGMVLLRDRRLVAPRLLRAELLGLLGGLAAVAAMFAITSSWPGDMGGPIDWLLAIGIFVAGGLGTAIAAYAVAGLFARRGTVTTPGV